MNLFDIFPNEQHPAYQKLEISNLDRQYLFFNSILDISLETNKLFLSQTVIKAFNYHAIVCLHSDAGQFRPCEVTVGNHSPPMWIHVQSHMDVFVNEINRNWENTDAIYLATYALWKMNWIHPFVNGNGRTARLTAYYILCMKANGFLPGTKQLPELLRRQRGEEKDPYVKALQSADNSFASGKLDLSELHALMSSLIEEQLNSIAPEQ